ESGQPVAHGFAPAGRGAGNQKAASELVIKGAQSLAGGIVAVGAELWQFSACKLDRLRTAAGRRGVRRRAHDGGALLQYGAQVGTGDKGVFRRQQWPLGVDAALFMA